MELSALIKKRANQREFSIWTSLYANVSMKGIKSMINDNFECLRSCLFSNHYSCMLTWNGVSFMHLQQSNRAFECVWVSISRVNLWGFSTVNRCLFAIRRSEAKQLNTLREIWFISLSYRRLCLLKTSQEFSKTL